MNRALLPLTLIIVAIATFFWWTNPHYANVKDLRIKSSQSDEALAQVAELESARAVLVGKENAFSQSDLAKLQKLLPDNVDNIRLFLDIQGIASRYGTSIQNISVADSGQKTSAASTQAIGPSDRQFGQMTLSFSVNTSYENLGLFLKDLEKGLRIVEIRSLGFTADDTKPNYYKISIGIGAFWLNTQTATAAIISSQ